MEEKLVIVIITFLSVVQCFALPFEGLYRLDIIHYNDFHVRFEETAVDYPTCRFNNASCLGGFPRLYQEINTLLKEKPDALLLNGGDSFQGTYWYRLLKWNVIQEFMNMLPHDAHAIGNHEFDDGPEGLAPYLSHLKAPVVAANMDVSNESVLQGLFNNSIIVTRNGRKIGIIGLITQETAYLSTPGNVKFTDPGEAVDRESKSLVEQGVDIIIVLSHCGLQVDKMLAQDHGENIDIIIGAHTHSLLWNGPSPSNETVAGPYPILIESSKDSKHEVVIVQASAFTKYMGNLSVYFDYRGDYVQWEGNPIFLNRSIPEDEDIKAKLQPYAEKVHQAENISVGEAKRTMLSDDCVYGECALGDLLVDALNRVVKESVETNLDYFAFIQRGNIKSSIAEGVITQGVIFELLPYNDRVQTFELQGRYVLDALERSVIDAWGFNPFKGPWLLQVAGLKVSYNVSLPEGQRLTSVKVDRGLTTVAFDSNAYYQVTAPSYLADGGDGFTMFKNKRNVQVIGRDEQALVSYIKDHTPLDVVTNGRITILS